MTYFFTLLLKRWRIWWLWCSKANFKYLYSCFRKSNYL